MGRITGRFTTVVIYKQLTIYSEFLLVSTNRVPVSLCLYKGREHWKRRFKTLEPAQRTREKVESKDF